MSSKFKKFLSFLLVTSISITSFCVPAQAAVSASSQVASDGMNSRQDYVNEFDDSGIISDETRNYTITITDPGTYTFTFVSNVIEGSGVWVVFEKAGGNPQYLDRTITGRFQEHYYLSTGTWYLMLDATGSVCSFVCNMFKRTDL